MESGKRKAIQLPEPFLYIRRTFRRIDLALQIFFYDYLPDEGIYYLLCLYRVSIEIYRGMNFQTEEERQRILGLIENGSFNSSFTSTSVNPKVADRYIYKTGKTFADPTKNYPIVITYKNTTKGAYIGHHSSVPTDQEVLFSDKVKFELLDKHEKDGILYLTMQERNE